MQDIEDLESQFWSCALCREFTATSNPYLTKETAVVRIVSRLLNKLNMSWEPLFTEQLSRTCLLTDELHKEIMSLWEMRKNALVPTLDEQQCVERVLGRDRGRISDLIKLVAILTKNADGETMRGVWKLFAVDGFKGEDIKAYVSDAFSVVKGTSAEVAAKAAHITAVRYMYSEELYGTGRLGLQFPEQVKRVLERAWSPIDDSDEPWVNWYRESMGTFLEVARDWRMGGGKEGVDVQPKKRGEKRKKGKEEDEKKGGEKGK